MSVKKDSTQKSTSTTGENRASATSNVKASSVRISARSGVKYSSRDSAAQLDQCGVKEVMAPYPVSALPPPPVTGKSKK